MKKKKNLKKNFLEASENKQISEIENDFESGFNYAIVISGKIKQLREVKQFIESKNGITIRYQTLDKRFLKINPEEVY